MAGRGSSFRNAPVAAVWGRVPGMGNARRGGGRGGAIGILGDACGIGGDVNGQFGKYLPVLGLHRRESRSVEKWSYDGAHHKTYEKIGGRFV